MRWVFPRTPPLRSWLTCTECGYVARSMSGAKMHRRMRARTGVCPKNTGSGDYDRLMLAARRKV
jgi:hypothetical protein